MNNAPSSDVTDLKEILKAGESETVEFKRSLRATNWRSNDKAKWSVELSILKSIAGFLNNREGGTLIVGVRDNGEPTDNLLENGGFSNTDEVNQYLTSLIKDKLGVLARIQVQIHPEEIGGQLVFVIQCDFNIEVFPVYVSQDKSPSSRVFYVRIGSTTQQISGEEQIRYIDLVRKEEQIRYIESIRKIESENINENKDSILTSRKWLRPLEPPSSNKVEKYPKHGDVFNEDDWNASTERIYPQWASFREVDVKPHSTTGYELSGRLSSVSPYFRFGFKLLTTNGRIFGDGSIQSQDDPNLLIHLGKNIDSDQIFATTYYNGIRDNLDQPSRFVTRRAIDQDWEPIVTRVSLRVTSDTATLRVEDEILYGRHFRVQDQLRNRLILLAWGDDKEYSLLFSDIRVELLS